MKKQHISNITSSLSQQAQYLELVNPIKTKKNKGYTCHKHCRNRWQECFECFRYSNFSPSAQDRR